MMSENEFHLKNFDVDDSDKLLKENDLLLNIPKYFQYGSGNTSCPLPLSLSLSKNSLLIERPLSFSLPHSLYGVKIAYILSIYCSLLTYNMLIILYLGKRYLENAEIPVQTSLIKT